MASNKKMLATVGAAGLLLCAPLAAADAGAPLPFAGQEVIAADSGERFVMVNRDLLPDSGLIEDLSAALVPQELKDMDRQQISAEECAQFCSAQPACQGASWYEGASPADYPGIYTCVLKTFTAVDETETCYLPTEIVTEGSYMDGDYFMVKYPVECGTAPLTEEEVLNVAAAGPVQVPTMGPIADGPLGAAEPGAATPVEPLAPPDAVGPATVEQPETGAAFSAVSALGAFAAAAAVFFA